MGVGETSDELCDGCDNPLDDDEGWCMECHSCSECCMGTDCDCSGEDCGCNCPCKHCNPLEEDEDEET